MKNLYIPIALVVSLTACGGGGGSSEPSPPPIPPSNSAPSLTLSASSIEVVERNTAVVGVQVSDPDGDSFQVTATANSDFFDVSYSNGQLEVRGFPVDSDKSGTVTVSATDSNNNATSRTLNVTVLDTVVNLSLSTTSVVVDEGQSTTVSYTVDQGVNVVVSESLSFVEVSHESGEIVVGALPVNQDQTGVITVTATDENNESASVEISVTVRDVIPPTAPPLFTLVDEEKTGLTPSYLVKGRTRHAVPFNLELDPLIPTDDVESMFSFAVSSQGVEREDVDFQFNVNTVGGFIELIAPIEQRLNIFNIGVTVNDGFNSVTQDFLVEIADNTQYISLVASRGDVTLLGSEEETVMIDVFYSTQEFVSFSLEYINSEDQQDNPLNMNITPDGVLTLSANGSYNDRYVGVRVFAGEGRDQVGIRIDVLMKDGYTQSELDFIAQLEEYWTMTQYAFEYRAINTYIANYYLASNLNQSIDSVTYNNVFETYEEYKALETPDNRLNREEQFLNSYISENIEAFYESFRFTDPDLDLATREARMNEVIQIVEQQLFQATGEFDPFFQEVTLINERLALFNNTTYETISRETLEPIGNNKFSRYVGNPSYGNYIDGVWTFNPEYSYLAYALSDYLKMELN